MERIRFRLPAVALTLALLGPIVPASGQSQPPTREGNIWGWRDHQPTEAEIQRDERAAGIAPPPSQTDSNSAEVDRIYRELLHRAPGQ
jgi:hypothetical protein